MTNIEAKLAESSRLIQDGLVKHYQNGDVDLAKLIDAQKYSLLNAGKRIRPFLVMEFCKLYGGKIENAFDFALAIEMIHTFSLIHDDLPCMDNDALRRGKPTNHMVYGEDFALLAGDAMLTEAFSVVANNRSVAPETVQSAIRLLAASAGNYGMMGGQAMDLEGENKEIPFDQLLKLHSLKTGALISASAALGCLAAGYDENTDEYKDATLYAKNIGLAFQVIDDILDVEGSTELLGKNTGSDAENKKTTFLTFMSVEDAKKYAADLTANAENAIKKYNGSETLIELSRFLLHRNY